MSEAEDIIAGFHAVMAALEADASRIARLYLAEGRTDQRGAALLASARAAGLRVERIPRAKLDRLAGEDVRHQGVLARIHTLPAMTEHELDGLIDACAAAGRAPFVLILDSITDPHNLGAAIRSAAAAGCDGVIVPKDKSAPLSAVARKAASGAAERLPLVRVTNLARTMDRLRDRGLWLVGAAGEADASLFSTDLTGSLGLVIGAEGKGLRRLTREHCDTLAAIPMAGGVESLNASAAAAVMLFEARRQRLGV